MKWTSKLRVQQTLAFQEPDRVPHGEFAIDFEMVSRVLGRPSLHRGRYLEDQALADGRWDEVAEDYCVDYAEVADIFGWDLLVLTLIPSRSVRPASWQLQADGLYTRGNGVYYARTPQNWMLEMRNERPRGNPLPPLDSIVYHEPELPDDSCFTAIDALTARYAETHYLVLRLPLGIDYPMFGHDTEEGYGNLLEQPELVDRWCAVRDAQAQALTRKLLDRCPRVDAVLLSEDYSSNQGPLVSPVCFRRWIVPGLTLVAGEAHRRGKAVFKHACGNNWALLDAFLDAGIDVYQSIQPSAGMDMARLKEQYRNRLTLWGGVSVESLIGGTPDDVTGEMREAIRVAAPGGGLIAGAAHSIGVGTKYENYQAMIRTLNEYGRYPISR